MTRYTISNNIQDDDSTVQKIDIITDLDNTHIYTNNIYRTMPNGDNVYDNDKCLNRFDINEVLLEYLTRKNNMSKIWTINPAFLDLDMAILMANIGQGRYLPKRFKSIWEFSVLRYLAGEVKVNVDNKGKLMQEAESIKKDLYSYVEEIKIRNRSLSEQIEEEYRIEELRALKHELERIQDKEDFLLDLMKDTAVVKNRILEKKNKFTR